MRDLTVHSFLLTQDSNSTTIFVHKTPGKNSGFWKSAQPNRDFRDTGAHDQFYWTPTFFLGLQLFNDIGLTDTMGPGHEITFSNADESSRVLTMWNVPLGHLKRGDQGTARNWYSRGHVLSPGLLMWEYQGMEPVQGWQIGPND
jgi:hypothetical protein